MTLSSDDTNKSVLFNIDDDDDSIDSRINEELENNMSELEIIGNTGRN
jgi:hypothetical protein